MNSQSMQVGEPDVRARTPPVFLFFRAKMLSCMSSHMWVLDVEKPTEWL